ncbi:MAG: hypothetical protein OHK0021_24110 [Bryobacter sp.]
MGLALRTDDLATLEVLQLPWTSIWARLQANDVHPPLFFYLAKAWTQIFSFSEASLHGVVVTIAGAFFLAIGRWGQQRGGAALAGLLIALVVFSPLHWLAVGIVRMYTLLMLLAWVSSASLQGLLREFSWRNGLLYAALVALGSFSHAWFFFVLFGQGVVVLVWANCRQWWRYSVLWLAGLAAYLIFWLPGLLVALPSLGEQMAWVPALSAVRFLVAMLLLLGGGVISLLFVRKPLEPEAKQLLVMGLAALALPVAISFTKPLFYDRFAVAMSPLILAGLGLAVAPRFRAGLALGLCLLGLPLVLGVPFESPYCNPRSLASRLEQEPEAKLIFTSLSRRSVVHYSPGLRTRSQSFPAIIDQHPNYEGDLYREARRAEWETEAKAISFREPKVFLLGGNRSMVEKILADSLTAAGYTEHTEIDCTGDHLSMIREFVRKSPN